MTDSQLLIIIAAVYCCASRSWCSAIRSFSSAGWRTAAAQRCKLPQLAHPDGREVRGPRSTGTNEAKR